MADDEREKLASFAIDPCHESSPDQLVLARMERKSTLAATLAELERSIASFPSDSEYRGFIPGDQVWIPEVSLDIDHRFRELEGPARQFLNKRMEGLYFRTALQQLRFRLDANGAVLDSVGRGGAAKLRPPINLTFDRPFLICVQKRGEKQPFLVMWIDNPGLMRLMRAPEAE